MNRSTDIERVERLTRSMQDGQSNIPSEESVFSTLERHSICEEKNVSAVNPGDYPKKTIPFREELRKMVEQERLPVQRAADEQIKDMSSSLVLKVIDLLSDHLEYTKLYFLQSLNIALSPSEGNFLKKFFVNTDIELDAEMEYLTRYWREEFMLRLKSRQQFLVDDYIPIERPVLIPLTENELKQELSALKQENTSLKKDLEQRNQELLVLEAMVERREKMIEENRKTFFKELLLLKEDHFKQLLNGSFEFLENEKLMDDIPRDMQTISMYYNAGAVLKGLKKIKSLEEEIEQYERKIQSSKQYEKQFAARENELVRNIEILKKDISTKDTELELCKNHTTKLASTIEDLQLTLEGCQNHYEDLQRQVEELERIVAKKNAKISELKNADEAIEGYKKSIKDLTRDIERGKMQIKRLSRQARQSDKYLLCINQLKMVREDLEARILSNYDSESIVERMKNLLVVIPTTNFIEEYEEDSEDEIYDYDDNYEQNQDIDATQVDSFVSSPANETKFKNPAVETSLQSFAHPHLDLTFQNEQRFDSDEEFNYNFSKPTVPRVESARKNKSRKHIKQNKRHKGTIDRWTDSDEHAVHTPLSSRRSVPNLITPTMRLGKELSETFNNVSHSIEEYDAIPDSMSGFDRESLRQDLLLTAEELKIVQKERAEYLLKQYYMLRKKDDILQRIENRTQIMFDKVRQRKEMLEQQQQEQLERCLNVYQLLSKEKLDDEFSAEIQQLKQLKDEYDAHQRKKIPMRPLYSPGQTVSDQIRPPSSFGVIVPGIQNRYHVVKRKSSIDERSMEEMFVCRQMNGSTPPPRPQTSFAPLRRPHSSAKFMRPNTTYPFKEGDDSFDLHESFKRPDTSLSNTRSKNQINMKLDSSGLVTRENAPIMHLSSNSQANFSSNGTVKTTSSSTSSTHEGSKSKTPITPKTSKTSATTNTSSKMPKKSSTPNVNNQKHGSKSATQRTPLHERRKSVTPSLPSLSGDSEGILSDSKFQAYPLPHPNKSPTLRPASQPPTNSPLQTQLHIQPQLQTQLQMQYQIQTHDLHVIPSKLKNKATTPRR